MDLETAQEYFTYNPDTGVVTWKKRKGAVRLGAEVGTLDTSCGYRKVGFNHKRIFVHRLAWFLYYGRWPEHEIDHIDGVRDNNAISNLRDVPRRENCKNMKLRPENTTGYPGVYWLKSRKRAPWRVCITENGRPRNFGHFETREEAIRVAKGIHKRLGYHENHGRAA